MKKASYLVSLFLSLSHSDSEAFNAQCSKAIRPPTLVRIGRCHGVRRVSPLLKAGSNNDWDREIDEKVMRRLQREGGSSGGMGETAAGAVLGGLLLGPFGALFGASIGSNLGSKNTVDKLRKEEMERMGLTPEIISAAEDIGLALDQSMEGLKATKDSLETQQRLARRLDTDATLLYEKAMKTIKEGDEVQARTYLLRRTDIQDQLKRTLQNCAEEKKRMERMEDNVAQLERRAGEVESLIRRNISAKTLQNTGVSPELTLSLRSEDPLLQKFRDLGID